MADSELQSLTALTSPTTGDVVYIVNDPAGTPASRKITLENLLKALTNLTADTTWAAADVLLFYDNDAATADKITVPNFFAGIEDGLSALATLPDLTDTLLLIDGGTAKYITHRNAIPRRYVQLEPFGFAAGTSCATGDGKAYLHIPAHLTGLDLVEVHAVVKTAGTTGTMDIQIANVTDTTDMLSTKLTIDSAETGSDTAATPAVIDTTKDDVATNDVLRLDFDAVHTTPAVGCIVTLGFG